MRKKILNRKSQISNPAGGFSLIEIILAVAIVLTLGVTTTGFLGRFINQNAVANTQDYLTGSFRKAQIYAMEARGSSSSGWGVNLASGVITLYQGFFYAGRNQSLDETYTINSNVTVTPGSFDVNFARRTGRPNAGQLITISSQGNTKTVNVNEQGMVGR